jgi:hypothetical protein
MRILYTAFLCATKSIHFAPFASTLRTLSGETAHCLPRLPPRHGKPHTMAFCTACTAFSLAVNTLLAFANFRAFKTAKTFLPFG